MCVCVFCARLRLFDSTILSWTPKADTVAPRQCYFSVNQMRKNSQKKNGAKSWTIVSTLSVSRLRRLIDGNLAIFCLVSSFSNQPLKRRSGIPRLRLRDSWPFRMKTESIARCKRLMPEETISSGWWFQTCVIFTPIWGNDPNWGICFKWVETTN